jgi:hypothetical protein
LSRSRSRASWLATAGRSQRCSAHGCNGSARRARTGATAQRNDPRSCYEPPQQGDLGSRERHRSSARTPGHAVATRAYQPRHNASTPAAALSPPTTKARDAGLQAVHLDNAHSISARR